MTDEEKDKKTSETESAVADEKAEAKKDTPEEEKATEETVSEEPENVPKETAENVPDTSELNSLKTENLQLKAQIEAYKAGFRADVLEDAVTLATALLERDGTDITQALQAVGEKYPDWKNSAENTGGFRVGAESPQENTPDDSRLDEAFGIRKRGK